MATKLLLALMLTFIPATSHADLITFLNLNEPPLAAGAHTEGAFTYQRSVGLGFHILNTFGNPASSLSTGFAAVGDTIDIFLTAGGLFRFNSLDIACPGCDFDIPGGDGVGVTGSNGPTTTNIFPILTTGFFGFSTANSPTNALFDRIQIRLAVAGTARLFMDNINLTRVSVSEPGSLMLLLTGLLGFGGVPFLRGRKK